MFASRFRLPNDYQTYKLYKATWEVETVGRKAADTRTEQRGESDWRNRNGAGGIRVDILAADLLPVNTGL